MKKPLATLCILIVVLAGLFVWFLSPPKPAIPTITSGQKTQKVTSKPKPNPLACVAALSDDTKIGQKLMFAAYDDTLTYEMPTLKSYGVGGIIIMNEISASSIDTYKKAQKIVPIIAVDQEGGTVQRYRSEGLIAGADMMSSYSLKNAHSTYLKDDAYLHRLGITTNFAPVVDVKSRTPNPLPGRMYSSDPKIVSEYARQAILASNEEDITPVIKHFPGMGSADGNTDFSSATTDPISILQTRDLIPYQKLASLKPDVMVANANVPGLTNGLPASQSSEAIKLLRSLGYNDSVVYTDSLTANAVPGQINEAVIKSWQAGADVALIAQNHQNSTQIAYYLKTIREKAHAALADHSLSHDQLNTSTLRILKRKAVDPCIIVY